MMFRVDPVGVHQIIAKCFQLAVRHARIEICVKDFNKCFNVHGWLPQNLTVECIDGFGVEFDRVVF